MSILCQNAPLQNAKLPSGFCAGVLPVSLNQPRSIVSITGSSTDFLTLERGTNSIVLVEDLDGDDIAESKRVLATANKLNHGLEVTSTHVYASSDTHVYRWPYDPNTRTFTGGPQTVIKNMNADGQGGAPFGHTTRTVVIDGKTLYVSVGSYSNIDADSFRSRIRKFDLSNDALFPIDFLTGTVFVDGLRNEVAMEMAPEGVLWGAGNSADNLERDDLGG
jgi:glucose/arabinose dehydrogenase